MCWAPYHLCPNILCKSSSSSSRSLPGFVQEIARVATCSQRICFNSTGSIAGSVSCVKSAKAIPSSRVDPQLRSPTMILRSYGTVRLSPMKMFEYTFVGNSGTLIFELGINMSTHCLTVRLGSSTHKNESL